MMSKIPQISEAELEVMKLVWELGEATSSQIVDRLTAVNPWKPKTVHTLITRLVGKGALQARQTGGKAFLYTPAIGEQEYRAYANSSFLEKLYNGSVQLMLTSFVKEHKISKAELASLTKMLEEDIER